MAEAGTPGAAHTQPAAHTQAPGEPASEAGREGSGLQINLPDVLAEVEAVFARYEDALVNNRVEVLDELFWRSPRTVRYGTGENLHGFDEIAAFRAGRPAQGLARRLGRTVITTFGLDFATAMTEFHREGQPVMGRQSQTWVRLPEGWRVVAAHVSLLPRSL